MDNKLEEIIHHLTKMALADGKMTKEEQELLESITVNIMIYDRAVEDALEDGIITEEEKETLIAIKDQLITEAYELSLETDGISDDELRILRVLVNSIDINED